MKHSLHLRWVHWLHHDEDVFAFVIVIVFVIVVSSLLPW